MFRYTVNEPPVRKENLKINLHTEDFYVKKLTFNSVQKKKIAVSHPCVKRTSVAKITRAV